VVYIEYKELESKTPPRIHMEIMNSNLNYTI
jgi:hypothetical protein